MTNYIWLETLYYLCQFESSYYCKARNNRNTREQSIRGGYKMKPGRIYLQVAASWVWLRMKSPCMIFDDSLIGNRTPVYHQLRRLIGPMHIRPLQDAKLSGTNPEIGTCHVNFSFNRLHTGKAPFNSASNWQLEIFAYIPVAYLFYHKFNKPRVSLSVILKPSRGFIAAIRSMGRKVFTAGAYLWVSTTEFGVL